MGDGINKKTTLYVSLQLTCRPTSFREWKYAANPPKEISKNSAYRQEVAENRRNIKEAFSNANLYIGAQHAYITFKSASFSNNYLYLKIEDGVKSCSFSVDVSELSNNDNDYVYKYLDNKNHIIAVSLNDGTSDKELAFWTPLDLIYASIHQDCTTKCFNKLKHFLSYNLLYVGKATSSGGVFQRFYNGHSEMEDILTQKKPLRNDAEMPDELTIFPFKVQLSHVGQELSSTVDISGKSDDLSNLPIQMANEADFYFNSVSQKDYAEEVEKLLISLFDPEMCQITYKGYPNGKGRIVSDLPNRFQVYLLENYRFIFDASNPQSGTWRGSSSSCTPIVVEPTGPAHFE